MIIIVDGPDGAGKTTLINSLLKSHPGSSYKHFSNPKSDEEAFNYYQVYAAAIVATDPNKVTVFDRSWLSDLVYGPVIRHRKEMSDLHAEMLESMVVAHGGGFIIYCTAPLKMLWSRCQKRGETYIKSYEMLGEIADGYRTVMMSRKTLPVVRYDTAARW